MEDTDASEHTRSTLFQVNWFQFQVEQELLPGNHVYLIQFFHEFYVFVISEHRLLSPDRALSLCETS